MALPTAWVLAPGVWGRVLVGVPLTFAEAMVWPVDKSRSLTVAPDLAGAVRAITTLFAVLPLALLEAWLAQRIGMGQAMALTATAGAVAMFMIVRGGPR